MNLSNISLREDEQNTLIDCFSFLENNSEKLCIFSHFDKDNIIDEYVLFFIKELYALGFDIIFVTTSEKMKIHEIKKLENYIIQGIVRKNQGYDFISWKIGLSKIANYQKYKQILSTNDSIFFPINNPRPMFEEMEKRNVDFWGINKSIYYEEFIESFFWVFNKGLINSDFFSNFWNSCRILNNKRDIINEYEFRFYNLVKRNNFKASAYINYEDLIKSSKLEIEKVNRICNLDKTSLSYRFWDLQIKLFNVVYIKKNILIKTNIDYNITTYNWKYFLKKNSIYDTKLIEKYLKRFSFYKNVLYDDIFFLNIEKVYKLLKSLNNKTISLYGYGSFGVLISTIIEKDIVYIYDKNFRNLNKNLNKNISNPDSIFSNKSSCILVTALGREEEITYILESKYKIEREKILDFRKLITGIELFSYTFLKLVNKINSLFYLSYKNNYTCYFFSTSKYLNTLMEEYYTNLGVTFLKIKYIEKNKNEIYFKVKKDNKVILEYRLA